MQYDKVRRIAHGIRQRVFEHTVAHNGGYLSQACSTAELLALLYGECLRLGPAVAPMVPRPFAGAPGLHQPASFTGAGYHGAPAPDRDRFFISPAHYALVVYAALVETGRMSADGLALFNQDGSSVEMIGAEHSPGMEVTTGSLGQGLSQACGVAWARRQRGDSGRVWVLLSDGELQEGQTWEAMQVIHDQAIDNLRIVVDVNRQQCDGAMASVLAPGDFAAKLRAFGVAVREVDGHDLPSLHAALNTQVPGQALVVLAHTDPCRGMSWLEHRKPRLHYVRFSSAIEREAMATAIGAELAATAPA